MRFGRVIGKVVLSHNDSRLRNARWLVVSPMNHHEFSKHQELIVSPEASMIVYDELGATEGDIIGITEGGEAMLPFDVPIPVDAYNTTIIDQVNYQY